MEEVAVGRRETLAEDPGPLLRDPADLDAGDVVDREVPGTPVLGVDRAEDLLRRPVEAEPLLPSARAGTVGPPSKDVRTSGGRD
jgi:hypothetical protein